MEQAWNVRIVGHNTMLNQLVAMAVGEGLHLDCEIHSDVEPVILADDPAGRSSLVLVDDADPQARVALCSLLRERKAAGHARLAVEQSGLIMREMEILTLVSTGATNDQIAQQLCISAHTVKTHLYNIFRKIGVDNRFRAALWITQNFAVRPDRRPPYNEGRNGVPLAAG